MIFALKSMLWVIVKDVMHEESPKEVTVTVSFVFRS